MTNSLGHGPVLQGCRVIELCWNLPGPYCGALLRDLGADVVRIQSPRHPDPVQVIPSLDRRLNHGKKIIHLDLQKAADHQQLKILLKESHIVIEGFRAGVAEKLGIGFSALRQVNPKLIYCSISGYGQTGAWAKMPAHDLNLQAFSGLASMPGIAGITDGGCALPIIDFMAAKTACERILAARLGQLQGTVQAAYIDQSMLDEGAHIVSTWLGAFAAGKSAGVLQRLPTYGIFSCLDGKKIALALTSEDEMWRRLCRLNGLDFRFYTVWNLRKRMRYRSWLLWRLRLAFICHGQDYWLRQARDLGLPVSPVEDFRRLEELEYFQQSKLLKTLDADFYIASALSEGRDYIGPV